MILRVDLKGRCYDVGDNVKFGWAMSFSVTLLSWAASQFYLVFYITVLDVVANWVDGIRCNCTNSKIACTGLVQGTEAFPNVHSNGTTERGIKASKSKVAAFGDIELTCIFPSFAVKYLIVS